MYSHFKEAILLFMLHCLDLTLYWALCPQQRMKCDSFSNKNKKAFQKILHTGDTNLSTCADKSTNTKNFRQKIEKQM